MPLNVIAECRDVMTGKLHAPGPDSFFPEGDDAQAERLIRSGCLRRVSDKDLSAEQRRAAKTSRAESDAEFAQIEATLETARKRRDQDLAAISDQIGKARADADAEIARIRKEVDDMAASNDPAAIAREQINKDGLFDKSEEELREIAKTEKAAVRAEHKKVDLVAAIRAKRAYAQG